MLSLAIIQAYLEILRKRGIDLDDVDEMTAQSKDKLWQMLVHYFSRENLNVTMDKIPQNFLERVFGEDMLKDLMDQALDRQPKIQS